MKQGLGTQLRHLIDLLDGAVDAAYGEAGLDYRPRYTPIMRVLAAHGSLTIGRIAELAGITQPAVTQTLALMKADKLVSITASDSDARQRLVRLSDHGVSLLGRLQDCWDRTRQAADSLDADLPYPLSQCLREAIEALHKRPFGDRIRAAHHSRPDATLSPNPESE
ncbi:MULTISPECIES: MarR family winged helix-turn-helix transcriptional regulator [Nitrospirillum]|uniref:MarR family protein n=1 Tax=Nitrospirillum amazonense TaxID=28077 RepID=A0A560F014_9PROT|nr:helix-turn-helix domain-containing protein [Nitrospirillum amazonense]MEC4594086.1 helix-turn-helix domain-containing protein [Nitrospirillum amazonense]TWB14968.1 MarR family protein [Nitrospirillum amazonense]